MRRAVLALVALIGVACGPLRGERVEEPVSDWSFVTEAEDVTIATETGLRFLSVLAEPVVADGKLYLHVYTIFDLGDGALRQLLEGAGVHLRVDGKVYETTSRVLGTAAEIDPILPALVRDNSGMEATGVRWEPNPDRYPGTQMRQWFFALESRGAG